MALLPQLLLSPPLQTKRNGSSSRISASNLSNSLILADRATVAPLKTTTTLLLFLLHTKEGFLYTKVRGAVKYSALFFV